MTTEAIFSTEDSICEDFALSLKKLVAACEKHEVRCVEYWKARDLLKRYGYIL